MVVVGKKYNTQAAVRIAFHYAVWAAVNWAKAKDPNDAQRNLEAFRYWKTTHQQLNAKGG